MKHLAVVLIVCQTLLVLAESDRYKTVKTDTGVVRGKLKIVDQTKKVWQYLSIPFATPPVGEMRFKRPQPVIPWEGTKDVWERPNSCAQGYDTGLNNFSGIHVWNPNTNVSEDCLYLSVSVPARKTSKVLPVMVWIYGGGFYSGTSTLDLYDAVNIVAKHDVIVVAIQYRLGPFGFLYLDHENAPGNMGLLDQLLALQWIKRNIEKFGGDPQRVTLFGESAGAASVSYHLLNSTAASLFHRAILQSASSLPSWAYAPPDKAQQYGRQLLEVVNCSLPGIKRSIKCLRKVPMTTLVDSQFVTSDFAVFPFVPTIDKYFIHKSPFDMFSAGTHSKKPLILGKNKNEGIYFVIYQFDTIFNVFNESINIDDETYNKVLQGLFKHVLSSEDINTLGKLYGELSVKKGNGLVGAVDEIVGDYMFDCSVLKWIKSNSIEYPKDTYLYQFNYRESDTPWPSWTGVMHGYEIPLVFGNSLNESVGFSSRDRMVSDKMIQYWVNFAQTGDPNVGSIAPTVKWEPVGSEQDTLRYMTVNKRGHWFTSYASDDDQCLLWDKMGIFSQDCCKIPPNDE